MTQSGYIHPCHIPGQRFWGWSLSAPKGGAHCDTEQIASLSQGYHRDRYLQSYLSFKLIQNVCLDCGKKATGTQRGHIKAPACQFIQTQGFFCSRQPKATVPPPCFDPVGRILLICGSGFGPRPLNSLRFG